MFGAEEGFIDGPLQQLAERLTALPEFGLQFLEEFFCVRHRAGGTSHGCIGMVWYGMVIRTSARER
jgi:hypothetical protein